MPPNPDITYFAETTYRNERKRFGLYRRDRRAHMYLIGRTGMGKSTLLETLIASDLANGRGFALLDPHGDLAARTLNQAPADRRDDLIYFAPADHPLPYNPLRAGGDAAERYLIASSLLSAFRKVWGDFWGPRMEHILRHALLTLAEFPGSTLVDLPRLLTDQGFRKAVIGRVTDESVRAFWQSEFDRYSMNFRSEAVSPILNKIGAFLASPAIRAVLGAREGGLDLRALMDGGKVLIANLSKGRLGEDASALIGALLIGGFEQAALARADVPEAERRDFYLYVDEVHSFATLSLAGMLQEARKYGLGLIMANQYLEQLDERIQQAILGNVGTLVAFRVGVRDAKILADEFFPEFSIEDFVNLPAYHIYLRLMIDGVVSRGFSARTLRPLPPAQ
jgi:type IV secretory pathway TraG/TraD family ATPase VirD4